MKKKMTILLVATMMIMVISSLSVMAYDESSTPAGQYGILTGSNNGDLIATDVTTNDGSGRLLNGYEVRDNITGSLYEAASGITSPWGALRLLTNTNAWDYPYPCAVYGSHEVRGNLTRGVHTVTVY